MLHCMYEKGNVLATHLYEQFNEIDGHKMV